MKIKEWLLQKLDDPGYRELVYWVSGHSRVAAIRWKHGSFTDYKTTNDSRLFKEWAEQSNRLGVVNFPEEAKRWKTNFRCALYSAVDVKFMGVIKDGRVHYRKYKLLNKADPSKAEKKRASNRRACDSKRKPKNERRPYRSRLGHAEREAAAVRQRYIPTIDPDARPALIKDFDESSDDYGYSSDGTNIHGPTACAKYSSTAESVTSYTTDVSCYTSEDDDTQTYEQTYEQRDILHSFFWGTNDITEEIIGPNVTTQLAHEPTYMQL